MVKTLGHQLWLVTPEMSQNFTKKMIESRVDLSGALYMMFKIQFRHVALTTKVNMFRDVNVQKETIFTKLLKKVRAKLKQCK